MISGQALVALIPHGGSMCLLEAVDSWDETRVTCRSATHRRPDHPLRRDGHLSAVHLLEYAAQADNRCNTGIPGIALFITRNCAKKVQRQAENHQPGY